MQLRSCHGILKEFLFRFGELHTVFTMMKVIGKYIDETGLDKILGGKGMKMSVEAHATLDLALSRVFINAWYN